MFKLIFIILKHHFISILFFVFSNFAAATEEVSARIVQVVTAEAVAVLKGEQEKEAQHKDQPGPLPLGKTRQRMFKVSLCLLILYVCITKNSYSCVIT